MARDELPEIWGPGEVVDFALQYLKENGGATIAPSSVQRWMADDTFPEPVRTLKMGPIYLADDVGPWVIQRLAKSNVRPGSPSNRVPDELRAQIAQQQGKGVSQQQVAERFGVSVPTVRKIWREHGGGQ